MSDLEFKIPLDPTESDADLLIIAIANSDQEETERLVIKGTKLVITDSNEHIFADIVDDIQPRGFLEYLIHNFQKFDVDNYIANSILRDSIYYNMDDNVVFLLATGVYSADVTYRYSTFGRISKSIKTLCEQYAIQHGIMCV
jgi:hypothetical protein